MGGWVGGGRISHNRVNIIKEPVMGTKSIVSPEFRRQPKAEAKREFPSPSGGLLGGRRWRPPF